MNAIAKEILEQKQLTCDLMESGIIRAGGMLVKELADASEDEQLTLAHIKSVNEKFTTMLTAYADAKRDYNSSVDYYKSRGEIVEDKLELAEGANDEHNE